MKKSLRKQKQHGIYRICDVGKCNNWLTKITASVKTGSATKETTLRDYSYDTIDRVTKMVYVDLADTDQVKES